MSIQEFFNGKVIFITGGTGYVGKALIEKLLRSCDGIENIYVLIREKKGKTPQERLKVITENALFDTIRKEMPHYFKKLVPISGDINEIKLGLSEEDRKMIVERVNIIYHSAASVRFDDSLKDAILLNTRGTREVVELALQSKNLVAFMHVSTAYCNADKKVIDEIVYPPHADWRKSIEIAEQLDGHDLNVFEQKYISPLPNTYTFAKSLAEHVVQDLCKGQLPAVILRPSVVVSTIYDPFTGWVDNFNGPMGLLVAGGKGLLKVCYADPEKTQNFIPVDAVVNMMLLATRQRELNRDLSKVPVYNACCSEKAATINHKIIDVGSKLTWDEPIEKLFWYPYFSMVKCWYFYYMKVLLYHMMPAFFADLLLMITGKKPILVKIQRKIYIANMAISYFLQNQWQFPNKNAEALKYNLMDCEKQIFPISYVFEGIGEKEEYEYFKKSKVVGMALLFKEHSNRQVAWRNTFILWLLDHLLHFIIYGCVCWILVMKLNIFSLLNDKLNNVLVYWSNL